MVRSLCTIYDSCKTSESLVGGGQPQRHAVFPDRPVALAEGVERIAQADVGEGEPGGPEDRLVIIADRPLQQPEPGIDLRAVEVDDRALGVEPDGLAQVLDRPLVHAEREAGT